METLLHKLEERKETAREEHKRKFTAERITARIATDDRPQETDTQNRREAVGEWFKEQFIYVVPPCSSKEKAEK